MKEKTKKREKYKRKRTILFCLMAFFSCVFLFSAWKLHGIRSEYRKSENAYDELLQEAVTTAAPVESAETASGEELEALSWPVVDFERLAEINPCVVGWLKIDGTTVDYPLVQGEDNWYYLEHLFNGEESYTGSLMLDCGNSADFTDPNSVIYAHHMKDGSMFGQLELYREAGFYEEHPYAYLITPEQNYLVRFFAGVLTPLDTRAWDLHYTGQDRADWVNQAIEQSTFSSGIVPQEDERILTLSTCSNDSDDENELRYVLLGVLEPVEEK